LSEIKNAEYDLSSLNRSTRSMRLVVEPVRYSYFTPSSSSMVRIKFSISTNWLKISTR
jgi:hypothetical protein